MSVNVGIHTSVSGRITSLQVIRADGTVKCDLAFDNIVTNTGLNFLAEGKGYDYGTFAQYITFGTGSAEPKPTDTACSSPVGGRVEVLGGYNSVQVSRPEVGTVVSKRRYQTGPGEVVGNLTECALLSTDYSLGAVTHALFRDSLGNPVTVTVLAGEQVIVDYELVFKYSLTDSVTTATINGVPTTFTLRAASSQLVYFSRAMLAGYQGQHRYVHYGSSATIGPVGGDPSGANTSMLGSSVSSPPYVTDSFTHSAVLTIPANDAAFADIGVIHLIGLLPCNVQIGITPRLTKTSLQTLKMTLSWTWSR